MRASEDAATILLLFLLMKTHTNKGQNSSIEQLQGVSITRIKKQITFYPFLVSFGLVVAWPYQTQAFKKSILVNTVQYYFHLSDIDSKTNLKAEKDLTWPKFNFHCYKNALILISKNIK